MATINSLSAHCPNFLVKKIFELHSILLKTSGVDIGQVVGDGIQLQLLGSHARGPGKKRVDHDLPPACGGLTEPAYPAHCQVVHLVYRPNHLLLSFIVTLKPEHSGHFRYGVDI